MVEPTKISKIITGDPEIGPPIKMNRSGRKKYRALLGWNTAIDTSEVIQSEENQLWCWTSDNNALQVFDKKYNRSEKAGEVRDCGNANFTMVRMFHPFWCHDDQTPKDRDSGDKERCRNLYTSLIRDWKLHNGINEDDDDESNNSGDDTNNNGDEEQTNQRPPRSRARRNRRRDSVVLFRNHGSRVQERLRRSSTVVRRSVSTTVEGQGDRQRSDSPMFVPEEQGDASDSNGGGSSRNVRDMSSISASRLADLLTQNHIATPEHDRLPDLPRTSLSPFDTGQSNLFRSPRVATPRVATPRVGTPTSCFNPGRASSIFGTDLNRGQIKSETNNSSTPLLSLYRHSRAASTLNNVGAKKDNPIKIEDDAVDEVPHAKRRKQKVHEIIDISDSE